MSTKISAVILAFNEEENIRKCLQSLTFCDEIIVVDDYSTDKTQDIVKNFAAKTYLHGLGDDFAAQRNFALTKVQYNWVLFVDADEIVSPDLKKEIQVKIKNNSYNGYYLKRLDYFQGRFLKFGETGSIKLLRLAKKDKGKWQGSVHETWVVEDKIGYLNNPILHYPHKNVSAFLAKINLYSSLVAQSWLKRGRNTNILDIIFTPLFKFKYNYFLKYGFLDGVAGFIMSAMMSFHSFLVRTKVYLSEKK